MKTRNKVFVTIGILFLMYLSLCFGALITEKSVPESTQTTPKLTVLKPGAQTPALVTIAQQLNIDYKDINLVYTNFPSATEMAYFSYSQTGDLIAYKIEVKPGLSANDERSSLAHEYYHYVWFTHPEVRTIKGALNGMYAADTEMQERMQIYVDDGMSPNSDDFANELFAIYCTEVYTPTLEASVATQCSKWVNLSSITTDRKL